MMLHEGSCSCRETASLRRLGQAARYAMRSYAHVQSFACAIYRCHLVRRVLLLVG